jgi:hypothetical protein
MHPPRNTCEGRWHQLDYYEISDKMKIHINLSVILKWQRPFEMISHIEYNLNANEDFVTFLTSKLITCFIDSFPLDLKSRSILYLLSGSEHVYWILDLGGDMHSIWVLWTSRLQECKGNLFFEVRRGGQQFSGWIKKVRMRFGGAAQRCQIGGPMP